MTMSEEEIEAIYERIKEEIIKDIKGRVEKLEAEVNRLLELERKAADSISNTEWFMSSVTINNTPLPIQNLVK
jgi:predicted phosphatase